MTAFLIRYIKKHNDKADVRERLSVASGFIGILCNVLLCITKFIIGTLTNSISITADAINNLSDASSSIVTILGSKLSNKPVDEEHPFGHGRLEYISALIVAFFIFLMGFELGKSSIEKIINPQNINFSILSVIMLAIAILVKLWMAYFNKSVYKETNNINMKAVALDSLNDCIATSATIAALLISYFTSFTRADGIIGIIVACVIIASGIGIVKDILGPLLGQPPSEELVKSIEKTMLEEELIIGVHDLIVHDYGPGRIIASAHAEVPSTMDICEIHDVIDNVEKKIAKTLKIVICIHMDPIVIDDKEVNKYKDIISNVITEYNNSFTFHDFKMVKGPTHTNLIFDLVIPFSVSKPKNEILNDIKKRVNKIDSTINLVITIEHSYV